MSKILVSEIEKLFKLLISKLKRDGIEDINIETDEYWIVLADEWNVQNNSPKLSVGSLEEDITLLKETIKNGEMHSYVDFDKISSVLRAISEKELPTS